MDLTDLMEEVKDFVTTVMKILKKRDLVLKSVQNCVTIH